PLAASAVPLAASAVPPAAHGLLAARLPLRPASANLLLPQSPVVLPALDQRRVIVRTADVLGSFDKPVRVHERPLSGVIGHPVSLRYGVAEDGRGRPVHPNVEAGPSQDTVELSHVTNVHGGL